jgi:hypothetical protein
MTGADSPRDGAAATRITRITRAITGAISGTIRRRAVIATIDPRGPISTSKGCGYSVRRFRICAPAVRTKTTLGIAGRAWGRAGACITCPCARLYAIAILLRFVRARPRPRRSIPRSPRTTCAAVASASPRRVRIAYILVYSRAVLPALPGRGRPSIAPVIRTGRRNIARGAR